MYFSPDVFSYSDYYPFGLKHNGYNDRPATDYKYKYNGKELQDELGLNWDSFKWRNYDYAIGRFMCIDPLAEKYAYNSTYAFQENKMGLARELEGLELVPTNPINFNSYANSVVPALKNFGSSVVKSIGDAGEKVAEVAGNTGTYVKIVAGAGVVISAVTPGAEEFTPAFVEMYNVGDKMSSVATVAKSTSLATQRKVKEATIGLVKEAVGNKIGNKIVKIPDVKDATKVVVQAVAGEVTDKAADIATKKVQEGEKNKNGK